MRIAAAVLALVLGLFSALAGLKAINGWQPGWTVLSGLPVYNFLAGGITVIAAVLIWKTSPFAVPASLLIFTAHLIVTALLLTVFREQVARQSILAMSSRLATWLVIFGLMYFSKK